MLTVIDIAEPLNSEVRAVFETAAHLETAPEQDWRDTARQHIVNKLPHAWVYRGGHHLAIHASPPRLIRPHRFADLTTIPAGVCLARIVEQPNTPSPSLTH